MKQLMVLTIVNTHGLKGEVRALYYADGPEFFNTTEYVVTGHGEKLYIESVRVQKGALLIKFKGIDTISAAEKLKGEKCFVEEESLTPLPEGQYYIADLLGAKVCTECGREIGTLSDIYEAGAGQMMEIRTENGKKVLIPFMDPFLKEVSPKEGIITVELIEGLIDEV